MFLQVDPFFCLPAAKSLQSCPTLCDTIDGSPPGSPVPGILQARTLEWVAISFSNAWKWKVKMKCSVVSDSSRPHGLQPTRFLCPWGFPGKSTGVGCHHLFCSYLPKIFKFSWTQGFWYSILLSESETHSVVTDSLRPHGLYSPRDSPGQNTGVGSLFLLQGIFQTQGLNPGLPHCRQILYQLSHRGSPKKETIRKPVFTQVSSKSHLANKLNVMPWNSLPSVDSRELNVTCSHQ